jgi:plastocyanin
VKKIVLLTLIFVALVFASCSPPPNVPDTGNGAVSNYLPKDLGAKVFINYASFGPAEVHIKVGQAVLWVWNDPSETDQVVLPNGIKSPVQNRGTWSYVFTKAGTYTYYSPFHYRMTGSVVVTQS